MKDIKKMFSREVIIVLVLVALIAFGIGASLPKTTTVGAIPVYTGTETWTASSDGTGGLTIDADNNAVCFPTGPSNLCDNNITWDGTDFIING